MKTNASILTQVQAGEFLGIAKGLSHAEHIAAKAYVSNTGMGPLLKSPAHYQAFLRLDREVTRALNMGTATHSVVLERAIDRIAAMPDVDGRTKEGKEIKAAFLKANEGKTIVTLEEYANLIGMSKAVHAHREASLCLAGGTAETSIFWKDAVTGVLCKARPDYVKASTRELIDLKTTDDASTAFQRSAFNFGYFRQAAFYIDGVEAVYGFKPEFKIVAVEKSDPWGVAVYRMTDAAIEYGRIEYRRALEVYAECQRTGEWPGYFDGVQLLDLPQWAW